MKTPEEKSAAEELDAAIARLEAELAEKRAQKARESLIDQLSDLAGFFVCLVPEYSTEGIDLTSDQLAVAIEVLRAAKVKYEHRIAVLAAAPADQPQRLLPAAEADGEPSPVTFDGTAWTWTVRRPGAKSITSAPFTSKEVAEMDLARFVALNDEGAPFQSSKSFRAAGTGSIRRNGNGYQWKLQRGGEALLSKTWSTREQAENELARVVADPSFVPEPRAVRADGKRPSGEGSIQPVGNGFQWRLSRDGTVQRSRTFATREEAESELAQVIADPSFVPAPKERERVLGTSPHHCSKCGERGHRAPTCPVDASAKRPDGTGTILPNGPGWRWQIQRDGKKVSGANQPTRELAEADLSAYLEREGPQGPALGEPRQACGRCGEQGHNARSCPAANDGLAEPAVPTVPVPPVSVAPATAPAAASRAQTKPSNSSYIHPGRGWGPIDDAGLSTHDLCKGTGRIEQNNGNGKTSRILCKPCGGQGTKRCLQKPTKSSAEGRWK